MGFSQPRLRHPIGILVEPIDKDSTLYDEFAREEIQIVGRANQIEIPAQIKYRDANSEGLGVGRKSESGWKESEQGYVLVRYIDASSKGWKPKLADRIVQIGSNTINKQDVDVQIVRLKPVGHYPGLGATMVKCFFTDEYPDNG